MIFARSEGASESLEDGGAVEPSPTTSPRSEKIRLPFEKLAKDAGGDAYMSPVPSKDGAEDKEVVDRLDLASSVGFSGRSADSTACFGFKVPAEAARSSLPPGTLEGASSDKPASKD